MAQEPRRLVPYQDVRSFFGAELRHWRRLRGRSQDELGRGVHVSGDTIAKIEKATRWPTRELTRLCDDVLDTQGALSRLWPLIQGERDGADLGVGSLGSPPEDNPDEVGVTGVDRVGGDVDHLPGHVDNRGGASGHLPVVPVSMGTTSPPRSRWRGPVILVPPLERTMVERLDELESLVSMVTSAMTEPTDRRVVAVCGPGGFGKTTLVTQMCHDARVTGLFDQVLWVEIGQDCTPSRLVQLLSDLCVHLGHTPAVLGDPEQAGFHLARVLAERRVLLVVDNVWSAVDLAPFLLGGPRCVRVVTSRNARVCPTSAMVMRLGPMDAGQIRELLHRNVPGLAQVEAGPLGELCGGWPLLAAVVGSSIRSDVSAGTCLPSAVALAGEALRRQGPQALDTWDADQRHTAIGQAITASVNNLDGHVRIPGAWDLGDRYTSLGIFPAAVPIPVSVLERWWTHAHGWDPAAVHRFCRVLAERCLISGYAADRDAIVIHDVFRAYLRHRLREVWADTHASLLDAHRSFLGERGWADLPTEHSYLWQYLSHHLREAGLDQELIATLADPRHVVTKTIVLGSDSLVADRAVVEEVASRAQGVGADTEALLAAARAMTGSAHLLHGLTSASDVATSLMGPLLRLDDLGQGEPVVDRVRAQLRDIAARAGASGIEVLWANPATSGTGDSHVGAVTTVAVHEDLAVSGGEDGTVRLWNRASGRLLRAHRGHTGWVYATAFSPDGHLIASAGDDTLIRVWNAATGGTCAVLAGHTGRIRALAFCGTGAMVASGAEDGQVRLWDVGRPGLIRSLATPAVPVWSLAFGMDDTVLAVTGADEFVRLYDVTTGVLLDESPGHQDWIRAVAFAPGEPLLATGSGDGTVRRWHVTDRRLAPAGAAVVTPSRVRCLTLTAPGNLLAAGEDATVRVIDSVTDDQPAGRGVDWIRAMAASPDGTVVIGCEDGALRTWSDRQTAGLDLLAPGTDTIWSTAFTDGGRRVLLGRGNGTIDVHDRTTGDRVRALDAGAGRVWSLSAVGPRIAAACGDGQVRVWSAPDLEPVARLNRDEHRTWAVAVSPDGELVATSTGKGLVRVWHLPSGQPVWERAARCGRVRSLAIDGTGQLLVLGGGDGLARVWSLADGEPLADHTNPSGWVRTVALDATGSRLAVGSGPGDITVVDVGSGEVIGELAGHNGRILMLSLGADTLVSSAADGTVRLWSLEDQRQVAQVRLDASLHAAAHDPRSGYVIAAGAAGATLLRRGASNLEAPRRSGV